MDISEALHRAEKKVGITQKGLTIDTGFSKSTINNWFNGSSVSANEGVAVSESIDDFATTNDLAAQFFGIFKLLDGDKFKQDALSVEAFAEFEEDEKVKAFSEFHIRKLLASNYLDKEEEKDLQDTAGELLDSLLTNYKLLVLICEEHKTSPQAIYKERRQYYISAGYVEPERTEALCLQKSKYLKK